MKRSIITLAICFVMIGLLAAPVMAASGSFGYTEWSGGTTLYGSYFGQSFEPPENMYVTSAKLWLNSTGYMTKRTVNVAIRSEINGTNLGTSSNTQVGDGVSYDFDWYTFSSPTPVHLTTGTTYYLVINYTSGEIG